MNSTNSTFIENDIDDNIANIKDMLFKIYENLLVNKVITHIDMDILNKWCDYF